MSDRRETSPPISLSESKQINAPLRFWVTAGVCVLGIGAAMARLDHNQAATARQVQKIEEELREFRSVARDLRDASIKISAQAESMQRQLDRMQRE